MPRINTEGRSQSAISVFSELSALRGLTEVFRAPCGLRSIRGCSGSAALVAPTISDRGRESREQLAVPVLFRGGELFRMPLHGHGPPRRIARLESLDDPVFAAGRDVELARRASHCLMV